ncbi:hypothetical protein [Streptomyces radicis]|uniref:Uncharacterized protein n=1 Tax=Streptomyces radicis TaxID=1750517 RepID=A0A3A9WIY7_9ACTN|nr:hypothetical protein [Streptomyces radicis]RKN12790.1 hypothetical protein D7319_02330 [Streptomyces radicis]RKN27445.1 hypothetical protein D7318_00565 [Streptomyces radicis]
MTELPLVAVFGLATFLIVRSAEVHWWVAALCFLFGFYFATTPYAEVVSGFVDWLIGRASGDA